MSKSRIAADPAEIAYDWWRRLASSDRGHDRASLARLRRAERPLDVLFEPAALRLLVRLPYLRSERVAIVAAVLAHVTEATDRSLPRLLGRSKLEEDRSATVSESRFRRLLQSDGDELLQPMRRLVRMAKGTANVQELARAILYWGDRVKRDWTFAYYGVAAPDQATATGHATTPNHKEHNVNG